MPQPKKILELIIDFSNDGVKIDYISVTIKGALYSSTKFYSLVKNSWSLSYFVNFKFVFSTCKQGITMATSNRLLSFYTLSLKLKLVCHFLFNGHEIFPKLL